VKSGAAVGRVLRIEGENIYRHLARHASTHGFGVADALKLAERLGQLPPKILLIGVEVGEIDALAPLSHPVRASLPALLEALHDYLPHKTRRLG
jgi:hydrogenase maturation protease